MQYDAAGNRLATPTNIPDVQTAPWTDSYTYDGRDELLTESTTRSAGADNGFAYDLAGDLTTLRSGAAIAHNSDDELMATGFVYDSDGDPTTYSGKTLTFDPEDRMTSLTASGIEKLRAGYRADGLRAWSELSNGTQTYYYYDGDQDVVETDSTGAVTAANTFGPPGLVYRRVSAGDGRGFLAPDPSGNTAELLSSTGSSIAMDVYDAYGDLVSGAPITTGEMGYGSQWGTITDPSTGLILAGRRYYDPAEGRWLSRDPIGFARGLNLYEYAGNNPEDWADPEGEGRVAF